MRYLSPCNTKDENSVVFYGNVDNKIRTSQILDFEVIVFFEEGNNLCYFTMFKNHSQLYIL